MNPIDTFDPEQGQKSDILANLPAILWQRRWLLILPLILCAAAGVAAALLLPRTYRSSAVLLVESQNLPVDLGTNPTGEVIDRRIAKIRQQILSRPDLVGLIQANNLYNVSGHADPLSKLVEKMRDATAISAIDANISQGVGALRGASSIAFSLSFDYSNPAQAQLVAQSFVDRLLKLDASETQSQAESNVRFLQDQQSTLQGQINQLEGEINRITGQNGQALANAGGTPMMLNNTGNYETQIAAIQRDNAQLAAQLGATRDSGVAQAEANLAAARAVYADDHPDVKLAESRLAAARKSAGNGGAMGDQAIRQQIASNNQLVAQLNRARADDQGRTAQMLAAQARGPAVLQQVNQLQSRADSLRGNLTKINSALVNAQSMAKLAAEQRGERLTLVDPPVAPEEPTSPNRPLLAFGGVALGGLLGIAFVMLAELVMQPIRSVGALTRLVGVPPLGVVPVLENADDHPFRRRIGRLKRRARRLRPRLPALPFRRRRKLSDAA